jgi:hypothetical protein
VSTTGPEVETELPRGVRRDTAFLAVALAASAVFRLQGLRWPLKPDEAGILLVSRSLQPAGHGLYGFFWVDRPPVLVGLSGHPTSSAARTRRGSWPARSGCCLSSPRTDPGG